MAVDAKVHMTAEDLARYTRGFSNDDQRACVYTFI